MECRQSCTQAFETRETPSNEASRKRAARIANDSEKVGAKEAERKRVEREEEKKNDRTIEFDKCV